MDLSRFKGPGAFGRSYRIMMEQDAHAPGSVDRVLAGDMIRLCPDTAEYLYGPFTPLQVRYERGNRPDLEAALNSPPTLAGIVEFTRQLGARAEQDLGRMRLGGTEEEIVRRGSDWCTDVARVACVLCQIAGFPSRLVYLFDLSHAYSGHAIVEAFRDNTWGALDSSTGVVYVAPDGSPASTWELMNDAGLVKFNRRGSHAFYTTPEQFLAAGIANYFCWERDRYDYTVSGLNDYCFSVLAMSDKGWPGGLRWLHGEDGTTEP